MSESGYTKEFGDSAKTILFMSGETCAEYIWKFYQYYYTFNGHSDRDDVLLNKMIENLKYMTDALEYRKKNRFIKRKEYSFRVEPDRTYKIDFKGIDYLGDCVFGVRYIIDAPILPDDYDRSKGFPGISGVNEIVMPLRNHIKYSNLSPIVIDELKKINKKIKSLELGLI